MTGNRLQTKDLTSGMSVADVLQADNISPADVFLEITTGNGESRDRVTVNTVYNQMITFRFTRKATNLDNNSDRLT
jgi:hypothetical protein